MESYVSCSSVQQIILYLCSNALTSFKREENPNFLTKKTLCIILPSMGSVLWIIEAITAKSFLFIMKLSDINLRIKALTNIIQNFSFNWVPQNVSKRVTTKLLLIFFLHIDILSILCLKFWKMNNRTWAFVQFANFGNNFFWRPPCLFRQGLYLSSWPVRTSCC